MNEIEFEPALNVEATSGKLKADNKLQQHDNYMGVIPWQLQDDSFRFTGILPEGVKVKGEPSDGKHPAHRWKDEPLCYNSLKMQKHLKKHPAYAVVCGHGNLVVLDVDDEQGKAITEELPETFMTLSATKKLPHIYFKVNTDEQLYDRYRYVPMTEAEEVEWVENFKPKADNKLILKPMIEVKGLGTILNGANSRIAEGKIYEPVTSAPIAEVTLEQLRDALWKFGVSWEQQHQKLMARLLSSRPDTYNEHHSTPKQKEQVSYGESGKWYDHPLWLEIMESVTMKEAYVTQGGRFAPPRHQCLFCGSRSSVELKDGGYRCYNPACKVYHKNSWFLYQAVDMQLNESNNNWKKRTLNFAQLAGTSYRKQWEAFLKDYKVKQNNEIKQRGNYDAETVLREFNKNHFIAAFGGDVRFCREFTNFRGESEVVPYTYKNFEQFYAHKEVLVDGKVRSLTHQWKKWGEARRYEGVIFRPVGLDKEWSNDRFYNKWRGFSLQPSTGSCGRILEHLQNVWCRGNKEHFEYLMMWFAHMVQKPEEKPGVAVVIKGEKGAGKSIIQEKLWKKILGAHFLKLDKQGTVTGRFNSHLEDKLLIVLEEAVWAGDSSAEGTLKSLVTERLLPVEAKGYDLREVDSYCRLFFNTNEHWAVPATRDERRFFVLRASDEKVGDEQYFNELVTEIDNGGAEAFLDYLSRYEVKMSTLRYAPKTAALLEDVLEGFKPVQSWLYDLVFQEKHIISMVEGEGERELTWNDWVPTKYLFAHFQEWVGTARGVNAHVAKSKISSQPKLTTKIKELMGFESGQKEGGTRCLFLPPREEAYKTLMGEFAGLDDFYSPAPLIKQETFFQEKVQVEGQELSEEDIKRELENL